MPPVVLQICQHCLRVTNTKHRSAAQFCSRSCHSQALQQYLLVEQLLDLKQYKQHCKACAGDCWLILRAACHYLQEAALGNSAATAPMKSRTADWNDGIEQGNICQVQDYRLYQSTLMKQACYIIMPGSQHQLYCIPSCACKFVKHPQAPSKS